MIVLTGVYCVVELVVGHYANCIALVADSFHVLSDCLALCITLLAIRAKDRGEDDAFTFGWKRAEMVGGLVNSVFLVALLFTVSVEAVQRLFNPQEITHPVVLLSTSGLGLAINILGLVVFREHGHIGCTHDHGGGGHGHSHGHSHDHSHSHGHSHACGETLNGAGRRFELVGDEEDDVEAGSDDATPSFDADVEEAAEAVMSPTATAVEGAMNHQALYLHIMGDALASVAVMIGVVVMWQAKGWSSRHIVDPLLSLMISGLLLWAVFPLVRKSAAVVLQGVPEAVDLAQLRGALSVVPEVRAVTDLKVWQLTDTQHVGSCRVQVSDALAAGEVFRVVEDAEGVFSKFDVAHVTVRPVPVSGCRPGASERV